MTTRKVATCLVTLAVITGLLASASGCGGSLTGSSNIMTREMYYAGFTKLEVSSAFEVDVSRGNSYFVSITANDNLFQHLDIRQEGKTLHIGLKQPRIYVRTTQKVAIVMPDLYRLELSGASEGEVRGFSSGSPMDFDLSGASSLYISDFEAGDTEFDISGASEVSGSIKTADCSFIVSGASTVELGGSANDVTVEALSASKVRLSDFLVNNAKIDLSGASKATINASGRLDGNVSGASELGYVGDPTLGSLIISGASEIKKQ